MTNSGEQFCLRWNDFETNISRSFRALRDEKEFFDVTIGKDLISKSRKIVCLSFKCCKWSAAGEGEAVLAHKVILSACSPYFRSILARHPHQHPLLFLRGVRQQDLANILDFMYHGEVNVAQEELNTFLAIAEELQVKGLTQEDKRTGQGEPAKAGAGQRSVEGRTGVGPPAKRRRHDEEVAEISTNPGSAPVKTELEPTESVIYPAALESGEHVEEIYQEQEEQYQEYSGYDEDAYEVQAVGGGARPESNKGSTTHFVQMGCHSIVLAVENQFIRVGEDL